MKWTWLNTTDEMNMIKYNRWNEHDSNTKRWTWTWLNTTDEMNMIKYNRWNEHD